jgi:hypothetical protein
VCVPGVANVPVACMGQTVLYGVGSGVLAITKPAEATLKGRPTLAPSPALTDRLARVDCCKTRVEGDTFVYTVTDAGLNTSTWLAFGLDVAGLLELGAVVAVVVAVGSGVGAAVSACG